MFWWAVVGRPIFDELISERALIYYGSSVNPCMSHGIPSLVEVKMVSTTTHKVLYNWLMFCRAF